MENRLIRCLEIIFIIFGITSISLWIHELFHYIDSKEPQRLCFEFYGKNAGYVEAIDFRTNEFFAYYFQLLFIFSIIFIYIKNN